MIAGVRQELEAIAAAIRDAIDQGVGTEVTPQPAEWSDSILTVLGMAPGMLQAVRQQIQDAMQETRASITDQTPLSRHGATRR